MREIKGIIKENKPVYYLNKELLDENQLKVNGRILGNEEENTITYSVLKSHNTSGNMEELKLRFDSMASHDITYVGIIQTARASGLKKFPLPYVLTNCHNSLCAVGGTINEDDHVFGLSAAKKYGGIYVPAHMAVIHQYMREMFAGCGKMILGSDSHTRYGALGTLSIGEGGPELVKQLLLRTYDIPRPEVVAIYLEGKPAHGVGPQDVALAIIGALFSDGFVQNRVMEFVGPGIKNLSVDYRIGVDVMTTETTCLSSIWETDEQVEEYLTLHGRSEDYKELVPSSIARYDRLVRVDLSKIRPMIAMPFHPSNVYTIEELNANLEDILRIVEKEAEVSLQAPLRLNLTDKIKDGKFHVEQGVIAGCAGGSFENIVDAASILENADIGSDEFALSVYPASQPIYMELVRNRSIEKLAAAGATIRTAFCGPCFGAGDIPSNNSISVRHNTRNFPSREGSKPGDNQVASVALMDARSVAATALNKGILTGADTLDTIALTPLLYNFDKTIYDKRVYQGGADDSVELRYGPNIADWPYQIELQEHVLLRCASHITDPVTTTDELIPSGETSSYRSNPHKLSEFTLSRKDPMYVGRAKEIRSFEQSRRDGTVSDELLEIYKEIQKIVKTDNKDIEIGSVVCAIKPGDGSAREQAASCQRVLGGLANIAQEYATKRYRSNLINWGMIPFLYPDITQFKVGDYIFIPNIKSAVMNGLQEIEAYIIEDNSHKKITLSLHKMTDDEREIILKGCLINYYASNNK